MYSVRISEQTATFVLQDIYILVLYNTGVSCAVHTESSYIKDTFSLQRSLHYNLVLYNQHNHFF